MKLKPYLLTALAAVALPLSARAQITVPSDGSDGALNVTADTVIDLSQAVTGTWNQSNTANAGKGVYDPEKWVIVFKYSSVNIAGHTTPNPQNPEAPPTLTGRRVTFKNHPSHAPVVWLVNGDVKIDGILSLNGEGGVSPPDSPEGAIPREPGPGGFRGGAVSVIGSGAALGPGGGQGGTQGGGAYASKYGNPQILPLIGGSGSGQAHWGASGSGGGGAILIVSPGTVSINGVVSAHGGAANVFQEAPASGGAVKIIAHAVTGTGSIDAAPDGRTRVEANSLAATLNIQPNTIAVPPGAAPVLWPPDNAPKVRVVSVDSVPSPSDPVAPLRSSADIGIQNSGQVNILVEATNFPIEGQVQVRVSPKYGNFEWKTATRLSGNYANSQWRVQMVLPSGFTTLQARATAP